jgi:hypothetical protein
MKRKRAILGVAMMMVMAGTLLCAAEKKAGSPGFFSLFYVGVSTVSVNMMPPAQIGTLVSAADLVPASALAVPVHADDSDSQAAGVTPFTYSELDTLYQGVKYKSSNYAFLRPMLGMHLAPRLALEVSVDWLHSYMGDMVLVYPTPLISAGGIVAQDGFYTHPYNDGSAHYTAMRMSSDLGIYAFTPMLVYRASNLITLDLGVICSFTHGQFQAQSGWVRNGSFELQQEYAAFTASNSTLGFVAGVKIGGYDLKQNKRSLFSAQPVKEMLGDISAQLLYLNQHLGVSVSFDIYPFSDYAR